MSGLKKISADLKLSEAEKRVQQLDYAKGQINIELDKLVNKHPRPDDYQVRRKHYIDQRDAAEKEWQDAKDVYHKLKKKNSRGGLSDYSSGKKKSHKNTGSVQKPINLGGTKKTIYKKNTGGLGDLSSYQRNSGNKKPSQSSSVQKPINLVREKIKPVIPASGLGTPTSPPGGWYNPTVSNPTKPQLSLMDKAKKLIGLDSKPTYTTSKGYGFGNQPVEPSFFKKNKTALVGTGVVGTGLIGYAALNHAIDRINEGTELEKKSMSKGSVEDHLPA
jgi:hypothetical protein